MRWLLPLVIVLLATVAVQAQTYRCRDAQGNLIFTDDPSIAPGGCQPLEGSQKGNLTVLPIAPPAASPGLAEKMIQEQTSKRQQAEQRMADWRKQAEQVAKDYRAGQRQRYYAPRRTQANIEAGRKKMELAAQRKSMLLKEMEQKGASSEERQAIEKILTDVPTP